MKRMSFLLVVLIFALLICIQCFTGAAFAANVSVLVNGNELYLDSNPVIEKGRVLVPLRAIFEALGASVDWDGSTRTVAACRGDTEISLRIGQYMAKAGGRSVRLDVPGKIINGRTLVPLRFVSESLGAKVDWDPRTYKVAVNYGAAPPLEGSLKISGSTTVQPLAEKLARVFMQKYPKVKITIAGGGSGVGIKDVAAGRVNIGNASRALKAKDPKGLVATTIAKDGVAVVVHPSNPENALTKEQVKKIFTGKITNWKDVGGKNAPIFVHSRVAPSGTFDFFIDKFLDEEKVVTTAKLHASNGLLRQAVAANKNAIGFLSMGYLDKTVKAPKMDGVTPGLENARNGTYKYVRPLNMVTKGKPTGLAKEFINFALSPEGQAIVGKEYIRVR